MFVCRQPCVRFSHDGCKMDKMITAWVPRVRTMRVGRAASHWVMGVRYAMVFPVPVLALSSTSEPLKMAGMAPRWMWVRVTALNLALSASTRGGSRLSRGSSKA